MLSKLVIYVVVISSSKKCMFSSLINVIYSPNGTGYRINAGELKLAGKPLELIEKLDGKVWQGLVDKTEVNLLKNDEYKSL